MKNLGFFLISFLLMILLVSCNTFKVREQITSLDDSITHYNVALRWAMYKEAYSYHYSPDGKQPPAKLDNLEQISVTGLVTKYNDDVEITDKEINREHNEAHVETVVTYFFQTEGSIKKIKLNQRWWFNEKFKQWFIDNAFPEFN